MKRNFCALMILFSLMMANAQAARPLLQPDQRIVFIGDSITFAGGYIDQIDAYLATKFPEKRYELLNLGIPSETACGLTEPDHPFPRPDVHERLGRLLKKMKPDVVIACYGMNDGIYHPFSEERFSAYQDGINRLAADCTKAGAKVILVTPPPFDAGVIPHRVVEKDADEFGYKYIYKNYDAEVLKQYAAWIIKQDSRDDVTAVIDIHTPMNACLMAQRKNDPAFKMSGDGVHPNAAGHRAIASALMSGFGFDDLEKTSLDARLVKLIRSRQRLLRNAWLSEVGHKRPGIKKGKPIEEAQQEASKLAAEISELN